MVAGRVKHWLFPIPRATAGLVVVLALACSVSAPSSGSTSVSPSSSYAPPTAESTPNQVASPAPAPGPASQGSFDSVHAAQVLSPTVALVIVNSNTGTSEASGFVIQSQGGSSYLATNNHVVKGSDMVQVLMPDGRHYTAKIQGTDQIEDVAVLKVDDTLPVAQFADSARAALGEPVVAIGSPLGSLGVGTVTVGVISALHRELPDVGASGSQSSESLADVLQTDAPINPGNSGGPLGDGNGRVVGMNTAGSSNATGIGYAIPSRVVQRVTRNLIAGKSAGHPYLGICFQTVGDALASKRKVNGYGVLVMGVAAGTPADHAGLKNGDVVEKVDGVELNNGQTLGGILQLHKPGDKVKLSVLRGTDTVELNGTLGDRPPNAPSCNTAP
jgi:putative serine protease PepD